MNDYKELIKKLRNAGGGCEGIKMAHDAADAIEQLVIERNVLEFQNHLERCEHEHTKKERDELVTKCHGLEKERDAAVADLKDSDLICQFCKHVGDKERCKHCTPTEDRWEWSGVQEDNDA